MVVARFWSFRRGKFLRTVSINITRFDTDVDRSCPGTGWIQSRVFKLFDSKKWCVFVGFFFLIKWESPWMI